MKFLGFVLIIFAFGCGQKNESKENQKNKELDEILQKYKIEYTDIRGFECELEESEPSLVNKVFFIEGIHPDTNQKIHEFYTPKTKIEKNYVIKNYAELAYDKSRVSLLQMSYEDQGDDLFRAEKVYNDGTKLTLVFDAKTNDFQGEALRNKSGTESTTKFIIHNCEEVTKITLKTPL